MKRFILFLFMLFIALCAKAHEYKSIDEAQIVDELRVSEAIYKCGYLRVDGTKICGRIQMVKVGKTYNGLGLAYNF